MVQSVDTGHPISKLSPFILDKAIHSAVDAVKTVRRLRNGDFLLEVTSAVQSRTVNKLDKWVAGCPVTASPHRTLNTCKGVIRCAPLVDCDKDQTLKQLKAQGVSDITNIGRCEILSTDLKPLSIVKTVGVTCLPTAFGVS